MGSTSLSPALPSMSPVLGTIERPGSLRDSFRRIFTRSRGVSRSGAPGSGMFDRAQNTNIQHATFMINQYGMLVSDPPLPVIVETVAGQLASGNTAVSSQAFEHNPSRRPRRESPEVYVDYLMPKLRGYPLWIPSPNESLPIFNHMLGVSVGDVGMLTPDGAFKFLFNIFHAATHSINTVVCVPDAFVPFTPAPVAADVDQFVRWNAGSFLADESIVSLESNDRWITNLEARGAEGAVLMIPEDLHVFKLTITDRLRKYVDENKVEWYKFVKHTLGHDIENGDLRVVYGCGKSSGFGIATAFSTNQQEKTRLSFLVEGSGAATSRCPYRWTHTGSAEVKAGPSRQDNYTSELARNQCLFVNTLDTRVSSETWKSIELSNAMAVNVMPGAIHGDGEYGLTTKSSAPSSPFTSESTSASFPSRFRERAFHPSAILQEILETVAPGFSAYIVCDDDWVPFLPDSALNTRDFVGKILEKSIAIEDQGMVFFSPSKDVDRLEELSQRCGAQIRFSRIGDFHWIAERHVSYDIKQGADTGIARTIKPATEDFAEVAIAVMGPTGSGKTTFINMASNSTLSIGRGLKSCTSIVQIAQPFELDGRMVTLIDTPGFDDTNKSDADILRMIAAFLATVYENGKTLAGVIYIHRISDFRMGGISTRNFKMFRQLCGESTLKNVVIVTNMWSEVSEEAGAAREAELASEDLFFKPVLDKGGQMLRHTNTPASAHGIISRIIGNHPLPLQIQMELVNQNLDLRETEAGKELHKDLIAQNQKHMKELEALQKEMQEAVREQDEETRRELEIATGELYKTMHQVENDGQKLASNYSQVKKDMEVRTPKLGEHTHMEVEGKHAKYDQEMEYLRAKLETSQLSDRPDLLRKIE